MRQLMLVTVLLGFLVSGIAIFLGDAFLFAKPDSGETVSNQPGGSSGGGALGVMQWLAAAAAHLKIGKDPTAGPGFRFSGGTAPPSASSGPSKGLFEGGHSGSGAVGESSPAAMPMPTLTPGAAVPDALGSAPDSERQPGSAAPGDINAEYRLGLAYRDGKGVTRDSVAAAHWLLAAAKGGMPQAQIALADLLASGSGVPRDPAAAYIWYDRAAASSAPPFIRNFAVKQRDRLVGSMSDVERAALPPRE